MTEEQTTVQTQPKTEELTTPEQEQNTEQEHGLLTAPPEQKPEEKPAEQTEAKKPDEAQKPAEQTYELSMREGFDMTPELQSEVNELFKGSGISQEQAQKFADFYMDKMSAHAKAQMDAFRAIQTKEVEATKADTEIGGDALAQNLGYAKEAMQKFGGDAFIRELEAHGMANNVEMIRLLTRVYHATHGDRLVTGRQDTERDAAHILYPELK